MSRRGSAPHESRSQRHVGYLPRQRIAFRYAQCTAQLVTRLDDDLAAAVDELIAAGVVANRSEAVRLALQRLVDGHRRNVIGARIAAGYLAAPQTDDEGDWSDEATVRIAGQPW